MDKRLTYCDKYSAVNNEEFDEFFDEYDSTLKRVQDALHQIYEYQQELLLDKVFETPPTHYRIPQLGNAIHYADELRRLSEWFKNSRIHDYEL